MNKNLLLVVFFSFWVFNSALAQTVTYYVPFADLIGMNLTSGDICSPPMSIEEAKQDSIGNTWGGTWMSTGSGTATSVEISIAFSHSDTVSSHPTTLNGMANNSINPGPAMNCAAGPLLTWTLDPTNYNAGGLNTFLVDYSASGIINQLDNLVGKGDTSFMHITVTYDPGTIGIEEEAYYGQKELVKITDLLGRETEYVPNKPLIYIYSDGTVRKVLRIE